MVSWSGLVISGLRFIGSILCLALVPDISNISRVGISNTVSHNLGAAIGKSHAVLTSGSITITVLILSKVGTRIVISNSVAISVDSGSIISGFMISRCGMSGLVCGSGMRDDGGLVSGSGCGFVDRCGFMVDRCGTVDRGGMIDGSMVNGCGMIDGSMDRCGMIDGSMVDRCGMIDRCMNGDMGRSMNSGSVLLLIVVLVNLIGGSGGLGMNLGMIGSMRSVDGGGDGGGVAVLDALVAGLVGHGQSQECGESDESLKKIMKGQLPLGVISGSFIFEMTAYPSGTAACCSGWVLIKEPAGISIFE